MTFESGKYPDNDFKDTKMPDVKSPIVTPTMNRPGEVKTDAQRGKSAKELEAAIAENRNALSADVKALSDKVTPANIKHEAKQVATQVKDAAVETMTDTAVELKDAAVQKVVAVADATVDKAVELKDATVETAHRAADFISETVDDVSATTQRLGKSAWRYTVANAVPLALIGVGAGWLLSNQQKPRREVTPRRALPSDDVTQPARRASASPSPSPWTSETDYGSRTTYPAGGTSPTNGERKNTMTTGRAQQPESLRRDMRDGVVRGAKAVRDETAHALDTTKRKLASGAAHSRDYVSQTWQRTQRASRELATSHPLALSLGTMLVGLGIGLLLPSTPREDALLQPSRDKFRQAIGQARDVADDVTSMAKDTAAQAVATLDGTHA